MNWIASGTYERGPPSHCPRNDVAASSRIPSRASLRAQWRFVCWYVYGRSNPVGFV